MTFDAVQWQVAWLPSSATHPHTHTSVRS